MSVEGASGGDLPTSENDSTPTLTPVLTPNLAQSMELETPPLIPPPLIPPPLFPENPKPDPLPKPEPRDLGTRPKSPSLLTGVKDKFTKFFKGNDFGGARIVQGTDFEKTIQAAKNQQLYAIAVWGPDAVSPGGRACVLGDS